MLRAEKKDIVEDLVARVGEARCLYLTDFTGLDVALMTELRQRLSGAEVEYVVVKNTLARRALEDTPYAELTDRLEGPNAFAISRVDVVSAAKILTEFAREHERPTIKTGAIEGRVVSMDEIRRLAELPPREELLAQVVGYARAPMAGLVYVLDGLLSTFVRTVEAVRVQREAEEETAPETTSAEVSAEPAEATDEPEAAVVEPGTAPETEAEMAAEEALDANEEPETNEEPGSDEEPETT